MSDETWETVMVTGHRKLPAGCVDEWLRDELDAVLAKLVDQCGMRTAMIGMAPGGDTVFGFRALEAGLQLHAAVPFPGQAEHPKWTRQQRADWHELISRATYRDDVHDRDPADFREAVRMLHARNDWMLHRSAAVVGIWAPGNLNSGTASCLRKAVSAGKPVILINLAAKTHRRPRLEWWGAQLNIPVRKLSPAAA